MVEYSFTKWVWVRIPLQSLKTSDIAPVSSKEFLDIHAAIECRFLIYDCFRQLKQNKSVFQRSAFRQVLGSICKCKITLSEHIFKPLILAEIKDDKVDATNPYEIGLKACFRAWSKNVSNIFESKGLLKLQFIKIIFFSKSLLFLAWYGLKVY